jgi:hypothetical protein
VLFAPSSRALDVLPHAERYIWWWGDDIPPCWTIMLMPEHPSAGWVSKMAER